MRLGSDLPADRDEQGTGIAVAKELSCLCFGCCLDGPPERGLTMGQFNGH